VSEGRQLERALRGLSRPRILIVGDLMLDRYVTGEVTRISPEAPIPVVAARHTESFLGGAGNVAANLRSMEAVVDLVGVIGDDEAGVELRGMLEAIGVDSSGLVVDSERLTIRKTRLVSGVQQMMRVDWEDTRPISGAAHAQIEVQLAERLADADAVILSDYGKGVLTSQVISQIIRAVRDARGREIPVLVDPKGDDFARYAGATLITPNRKEAQRAVGRSLPDRAAAALAADELIELADLDMAVITLGAGGILWRTKGGAGGHAPAVARAVFDVTGAGDTVVAHLALYLAAGLDVSLAVRLANHAAGIVVARLGTNAVTRAELRTRLREATAQGGKEVDGAELDDLLAVWQKEERRIVFTNGCFDLLHIGHIEYLRAARDEGDVLLVGINDDASVRRLKGPDRPINSLQDRMAILAALEMVDAVTSFSEDTPERIIEHVSPDVLVKGQDWAEKGVVGREWVEQHGGRVVLAELVPDRSTSDLLRRARGEASEGESVR
jgi:D-beta-D-heptose 7-phosphate kinase/D-beta-D-heptose 1-phosphate adenosyltransferase